MTDPMLALPAGAPPAADVPSPPPPTVAPPAAPRRVLLLAVPAGAAVDVALRASGVGVAAAALPIVLGLLLVAAHAVRSTAGYLALFPVPLLAPWLAVRANGTTQTLDVLACFGCLAVAVSFGAGRGGEVPVPGAGRLGRLADVAAGMVEGPRYAWSGVRASANGPARSTVRAVGRGVALAVPVVVVVAALLADADRSFAALFGTEPAATSAGHVALAVGGGVAFVGLVRTGLARRRSTSWIRPIVGQVEAAIVLGALAVILGLFALTRLVEIAAPGPPDPRTAVLADEARAGFFQLVAVVVIVAAVVTVVRLTVVATGRLLVGLAGAVVGLGLVVVAVAIHRLLRYRDEYGLTQLRLGTTWFSAWLGVVLVVIGLAFAVQRVARLAPAFVFASALLLLLGWNASNPDATIARTNVARAAEGKRFDPAFLGGMSADAVPTVVAEIGRLTPDQRQAVLDRLCARPSLRRPPDGTAWNRAGRRAATALADVCA